MQMSLVQLTIDQKRNTNCQQYLFPLVLTPAVTCTIRGREFYWRAFLESPETFRARYFTLCLVNKEDFSELVTLLNILKNMSK